MSHSVFETIDQAAFIEDQIHGSERISEPPKKWRNFTLVLKDEWFQDRSGPIVFHFSGEKVPSRKLWPSKEIAEQKWNDWYAKNYAGKFDGLIQYLGAEPEE